jgi:hypothetical protein
MFSETPSSRKEDERALRAIIKYMQDRSIITDFNVSV